MSTYEFWCIGTLVLKSLLNTLAGLKKSCRTVGCRPCQASSSQCQSRSMQSTTVMQSQHEALFWCIGTLVNLSAPLKKSCRTVYMAVGLDKQAAVDVKSTTIIQSQREVWMRSCNSPSPSLHISWHNLGCAPSSTHRMRLLPGTLRDPSYNPFRVLVLSISYCLYIFMLLCSQNNSRLQHSAKERWFDCYSLIN